MQLTSQLINKVTEDNWEAWKNRESTIPAMFLLTTS